METILLICDLTHDYPLPVFIWQCNMAFTHGEIACQHLSRSDFDLCLPTGYTYISVKLQLPVQNVEARVISMTSSL